MPKLSVVTGSYNEEGNVRALYDRLCAVFEQLPGLECEIIWIDNHSRDNTVGELRKIAATDPRLKVIVNTRNFGPIRSGYHAFLQATGDAVILMASDLQDPPELIPEFVKLWQGGKPVVLAQKNTSEEPGPMFALRRAYYRLVNRLAEIDLEENVTGFGLYDQDVIRMLRHVDDPYPYLRGLICDLGYPRALVPFTQPKRKAGRSKSTFYVLFDYAMLGFTSHSKVPLRLATMFGFAGSALSLVIGLAYLVAKLVFWNNFTLGLAPVVVGLFLFASVQLFFTGLLGEYIGSIHTHVIKRPHVVEQERINFGEPNPVLADQKKQRAS